MRTKHRISEVLPRQEHKARIQGAIQLAIARAAIKTTPHRRNQVLETLHKAITTTINPNVLEQLVVRWIVRCSVPFIMVETEEFCTLANYLNPNASSFLKSADTTYAWLLRTRENEMNAQKLLLSKAISKIHVVSDTWRSPANIRVFGIVLTFIGEDCKRHTILANLHQLFGPHDAA